MGGKDSKVLCCRSSSNSTLSSSKKQNDRKQSFQSDHYQNIEDYLVDRSSTNVDSITPKMNFQPLFFDFNKCSLSSNPIERTQGNRSDAKCEKNSKFDNLIETVMDFFDTKIYTTAHSSLIQSQQPLDQKDQYERAYIDPKGPSELTIYLKRESTLATKYHSQVSEYVFNGVSSLDEYLERIEVKLNDQMDHQIESSKILYQQKLKEGFQLQIIYVIFKKLNYQKSRDLTYVKIHKMIDENTCIQAYQSVQIKCEQSTLIDPEYETNLALAAAGTSTAGTQTPSSKPSQPYIKQKTQGTKSIRKASSSSNATTDEKYERALLYMGGKKISFNKDKKEILVQELQSLDMKVDYQHIFQKEVMIYQTKKIFEKIKTTLSLQQGL